MKNPFSFREIPITAPFCDREKELSELTSHGVNKTNVVLYSPRRYGKTSLIKRVQHELSRDGMATVYVDLMGVDSIDTVATRLAMKLYDFCQSDKTLMQKAWEILKRLRFVFEVNPTEPGGSVTLKAIGLKGIELLEQTMKELGIFIAGQAKGVNIVFDEFQDITVLHDSRQIEGVLRSNIQNHSNASYFFLGSRRRMLQDMFSIKNRAFYKSAIQMPLPALPFDKAAEFIVGQFSVSGKNCSPEIATSIVSAVNGYPYYVQRIPYSVFEKTGDDVNPEAAQEAFSSVMEEEDRYFQVVYRNLSPQQKKLLKAIATKPVANLLSQGFIQSHGFTSAGGIQQAQKKLEEEDLIEKNNGVWSLTDPIMAAWLRQQGVIQVLDIRQILQGPG